jgi:transmembrane sensor
MPMSEPPLPQQTIDHAIDWMVRLKFSVADADTQKRFEHWCNAHPDHLRAWLRLDAMSSEFGRLPPALSRNALESRFSRRESLKLLGLTVFGSGALWLAGDHLVSSPLMADLRSEVGERFVAQGPSGSRIWLNTQSAVDVRPAAEKGLLILRQGEIIVDTGAEHGLSPAPSLLEVQSRDGLIQTRSARFLLREKTGVMDLSVQRGSVEVFPGNQSTATPLTVSAGRRLAFNAKSAQPLIDNGIDPWGWSDGVLSARQASLAEVLAELSRYRRGFLRCAEDAAGLMVSGSFQLADTDQVLALLTQALPIKVDYRTRFWASVSRRSIG